MNKSELRISRWLDAHCDRNGSLLTLSRSLILCDACGDSDFRLVLADIKLDKDVRSRLKVFRGPVITADISLPDIPSGLISFYTDQFEPKIPAIGISCGSDLLLYKNNKPYFKFSVPSLPIDPLETTLWKKIGEEEISDIKSEVIEPLKTITFEDLTARSQKLLTLPEKKWPEFTSIHGKSELVRRSTITCITTVKKNYTGTDSISCPVLATESGQVYFLDPQTLSILQEAKVSSTESTPMIMECVGAFDMDYRLVIACREGHVSLLRRAWIEGKLLLKTTSNIVDMVQTTSDNSLIVATYDKNLTCYSKRGIKTWSISMKNAITCICLIPLKHFSTTLICVGMRGGVMQLYQGQTAVDQLLVPDTPSAIIFGRMGQEDHVLIIITEKGAIDFKILKRTADFNLSQDRAETTPEIYVKPLPIPKRSKLFLEQTQRERQNAVEMHQHFQQDLIRIRLTAARSLVNQNDQLALGSDKEMIKIAAQVLGLGPKFTLIINVENMNADKPAIGLIVVFHTNPNTYRLSTNLINIPLIPPNLSYKLQTQIEENLEFSNDQAVPNTNPLIRVFVIRDGQADPVLAAAINMPPTDTSALIIDN